MQNPLRLPNKVRVRLLSKGQPLCKRRSRDYEPTRPMLRKEAAASLALFSDRINDLLDMKY
ncbi:hypothetical protein G8C92_12060 [Paenibacillus donghaensis]|uniref:hypothetical protein n=1 Tax=Paenibacillus donghaensis TaxID=414771 RepID=UPI001884009E|nr:hypothetical protein [Paenibacillus donghaensis]MBE9914767.1 hypothetical protein [Paenibacillus donghaensis]